MDEAHPAHADSTTEKNKGLGISYQTILLPVFVGFIRITRVLTQITGLIIWLRLVLAVCRILPWHLFRLRINCTPTPVVLGLLRWHVVPPIIGHWLRSCLWSRWFAKRLFSMSIRVMLAVLASS